jgi:hypothetical protein
MGKAKRMEIFSIDIGDTVVCDYCNADYTESDEGGGVLLGSYAVCPACVVKFKLTKVDATCPAGMTFKEWVLQLRNGNNTIRVTWE